MSASKDQAKSIFLNVLEIQSETERQAFILRQCDGDERLRQAVERLLGHFDAAESFLESPAPAVAESQTLDCQVAEQPGTEIGPYKLLQQLGEGGMGVVYMAEQKEPIKRRVALKIIKPGMDSQQVLARFEVERQTLAMMDHPNIARVLDAGMTDSGRPFFVMDLVKGVPIDVYCDEHNLTARERLELFIPVCHALQHAHHRGIVHRDVKPSNVLVAEFDNQVVPKVIDFGVSKAIDQQLTERTMFTRIGQIVGTPEYMSPEQAKLNQLDVDTRSDIYSLGVLLYELLTGATPFDKQRLRSVAFEELLRIIREEDPPRPSVRLSTVNEPAEVATKRKSEPGKLSSLLRGELDWMVMKALDKERSRRYDSANAFADDVQRYLNGDRVLACPPTRRYLLRKFAKRHQAGIGMIAVIVTALFLGIIGTTSMAFYAFRQQAIAEAALAELLDSQVEGAFIAVMSGDLTNSGQAIHKAQVAGASTTTILTLEGLEALYGGDIDKSIELIRRATEHDPKDYAAWVALRMVYKMSWQLSMAYYVEMEMEKHGLDLNKGYRNDHELLMMMHGDFRPDDLDDLIRRRPTWAGARLIRAERVGMNVPRELFERAINDLQIAKGVLPPSRWLLAIELLIHLRIIQHGAELHLDVKGSREKAALAAAALDEYVTANSGSFVRAMYYWEIDEKDRAEQEVKRLLEAGCGGEWTHAVECYREGDFNKAKRILSAEPYPYARMWLAYVEAESDPIAACKTYNELTLDLDPGELRSGIIYATIPLLLGVDLDDIRPRFKDLAVDPGLSSLSPWHQFFLGHIDEDAALEMCDVEWKSRTTHFWIGMVALNQNDREKAKCHFREASHEFIPGWAPFHWSLAFLERLEKDPNWPATIQRRKLRLLEGKRSTLLR